jgi:hypothetical protein
VQEADDALDRRPSVRNGAAYLKALRDMRPAGRR